MLEQVSGRTTDVTLRVALILFLVPRVLTVSDGEVVESRSPM